MAKNRTAKSCYESAYGGGWITAHQRLAEMACERMAGPATQLPSNFWQDKQWSAVYRREATHASKLLASFANKAIINAWESREGRRRLTLGTSAFRQLVELEQRKLDAETIRLEQSPIPESVNTLEKPRTIKRAGKSIREKLKDNAPNQGGLFKDGDD